MLPKGENVDDVLLESNAEREANRDSSNNDSTIPQETPTSQKKTHFNKFLIFLATLVTSKEQFEEAENRIIHRNWMFPPCILTFFTLFTIVLFFIYNIHSGIPCYSIFASSNGYDTLIWQHFTHVFLHLDLSELAHNIFNQLLIGIPLEIAFGTEIIASAYVAGAILPEIVTLATFDNGYVCGSFSVDNVLVFISLTNWIMNRKTMRKKYWNFGIISILLIHTIIDIKQSIDSFSGKRSSVFITLTVYTCIFYCYTAFIGIFTGYFIINKKYKHPDERCSLRIAIYGFAIFSLFVPILYRKSRILFF